MKITLPNEIVIHAGKTGGHLQGIAVDANREYIYCSFTTCLIKADRNGNMIGSVNGLVGHLGCIAWNGEDNRVYGSLEFKQDAIGRGILKTLGRTEAVQDGFYLVRFDPEKITRMDMDAEKDGVMEAMLLHEVCADYAAPGHRHGCSGIDGTTFAPDPETGKLCALVAYGVYGDNAREDNDYQVILQIDPADFETYAAPLDQQNMHRNGPEKPMAKYFAYTGNTTYGIQNLEYDPETGVLIAAVYPGKKPQFANYPMFFIDWAAGVHREALKGLDIVGDVLSLSNLCGAAAKEIVGSDFPLGSTGIAALGGGVFCIAEPFRDENGNGGILRLYRMDRENRTFTKI